MDGDGHRRDETNTGVTSWIQERQEGDRRDETDIEVGRDVYRRDTTYVL
jgi:hypothetical protein